VLALGDGRKPDNAGANWTRGQLERIDLRLA
jgi:hypothetical protein